MNYASHSFDGPHDPDQAARDYFDELPAHTPDDFNDFVDQNVRTILDEEWEMVMACVG